MHIKAFFAGFGGQGVLSMGHILAYAAMLEDKHVTYLPAYGAEVRGGTANCTVIIADEEIGAPTVRNPRAAMVFNLPSFDKYEPQVVPGGVLISNASLMNRGFQRNDLNGVLIPANEIAESLGDKRLTNMVMLGALLEKLPILSIEAIEKALAGHLPERHRHLLPLNSQALRRGADFAQKEGIAAVMA